MLLEAHDRDAIRIEKHGDLQRKSDNTPKLPVLVKLTEPLV